VGYLPSNLPLPPVELPANPSAGLSNSRRQSASLPIELTPA